MQRRQLNAASSAQCNAVSSMQGRQRRAASSMQDRQLSAAPSAQCSAVSSMQRREFTAGPSGPVNSMQGPSVSMQARLFQCRAVSSMQRGLSAQHRNCSKQGVTSMQCRAVCSMQGRLLNATRCPSAQRNAFLLNARPSARCKAVRFNAGPCVSMQGSLNARPSLQCRATSSTQGRHLNAWTFGWLDQDLLRELSSEKKPTPWCLFSEEAYFGRWVWSVGVWWSVGRRWEGREEEAYPKVPFLFPQETCLRAPFFVFENYIWRPLTVPPESSPSGGAFFFKPSTEIKPTWCCFVVFQASDEGNQPENVVLFSDIPLERSVRLLGGMREGKGKGKGKRGGRNRPVCTLLVWLLHWKENYSHQPTNNQLPTNTQPTSPTNIQHGGPPSAGSPNISLSSFSHFLFFFSLFESLFFPVGDAGCLLSSLPKRLHKMTGELPMCIFGSPTIKNSNISTKKPRRILGPHFSTRTFLALLLFSVIQMFFFFDNV